MFNTTYQWDPSLSDWKVVTHTQSLHKAHAVAKAAAVTGQVAVVVPEHAIDYVQGEVDHALVTTYKPAVTVG